MGASSTAPRLHFTALDPPAEKAEADCSTYSPRETVMAKKNELDSTRPSREVGSVRRMMMSEEQLEELRAAMDKLVRAVEEKLSPMRPQPAPVFDR